MKLHRLIVPALLSAFACASGTDGDDAPPSFEVVGVSGQRVVLDRLWRRGCIPGQNGITWTLASRTLIGRELSFSLVDYQNTSATPDCAQGLAGRASIVVQLVPDEHMVPIEWVDPTGATSTAPAGLEAVRSANGVTATMSAATITPATATRAAQLNAAAFCGFSDWSPGVSKDVVACLTGGVNPFKATLVVDDRASPWSVYDGVGARFDAAGYPVDMANYLPHSGPFALE